MAITSSSRLTLTASPTVIQLSNSVAGKVSYCAAQRSRFKWANDGIYGSSLRSESANEVTSSATLRSISTVQGVLQVLSLLGGNGVCSVSVTGEAGTRCYRTPSYLASHWALTTVFDAHQRRKGKGRMEHRHGASTVPHKLVLHKSAGGAETLERLDQTEARDLEVWPAFSPSQQ
ncbi:unnamed protein product [Fusarium venenatum]|uniref:Uncharacterized protein n=1 Tax=Fusarium venenatum TaxID=56646 RepID=A0A2L2T2U9_9HYPO|nr:LOW QUALITY PROTEIN: uncharacterized protein FVRRES_12210 [Fusarium venenatum]CEI39519.1 unnamed protein product [Fusarium venenatum]